jgi:hypothetical protein
MLNKVVTVDAAYEQGDTPNTIMAIADWHDARSSKAGDRHDMISFRLHRLARDLRGYRHSFALAA